MAVLKDWSGWADFLQKLHASASSETESPAITSLPPEAMDLIVKDIVAQMSLYTSYNISVIAVLDGKAPSVKSAVTAQRKQ
jgi:hypothetical protein